MTNKKSKHSKSKKDNNFIDLGIIKIESEKVKDKIIEFEEYKKDIETHIKSLHKEHISLKEDNQELITHNKNLLNYSKKLEETNFNLRKELEELKSRTLIQRIIRYGE